MSDLGLFGAYASSGSSSDGEEGGQQQQPALSSSSEEEESSSLNSAEECALEAEARIKDYGEVEGQKQQAAEGQATTSTAPTAAGKALPPADAIFNEVNGIPEFLDPESTRPLAPSHMQRQEGGAAVAGPGLGARAGPQHSVVGRGSKGQAPSADFDISRLAPPLKGQKRAEPGTFLRPGAVIEGKAKRYKTDDEVAPVYSDVQVAMLGGQVKSDAGGAADADQVGPRLGPVGPSAPPVQHNPTKVKTKPQPMEAFLDKGLGGQQLPRKNQDRKEREKHKREKGQSTHSHWKSETEMALRQRYDD